MLLPLLCGLSFLLLQAPLLASAQTCTTNPIYYTTSPKQVTLTSAHKYDTSLSCVGETRTALYASFSAPATGNYYFLVPNTAVELAVEIRSGNSCGATPLACSYISEAGSSTTGIRSVALTSGSTYIIFVAAYNSSDAVPSSVELSLGRVTAAPVAAPTSSTNTLAPTSNSNSCTDNAMESIASSQFTYINTLYQHSTKLSCMNSGADATSAQYTSFTPPTSGNYYVRAPYIGYEIVVELRTASCTGTSVNCGGYIASESTEALSKAGLNSVYLNSGTTYVILVAPKNGGTMYSSQGRVEVGPASATSGSSSVGSGVYALASTIAIAMAMLL